MSTDAIISHAHHVDRRYHPGLTPALALSTDAIIPGSAPAAEIPTVTNHPPCRRPSRKPMPFPDR
jgi:hypothetical protein